MKDLVFIKELIYGPLENVDVGYPYSGRGNESQPLHAPRYIKDHNCILGPEKHFLYEIVSNKITGVDVDKVNEPRWKIIFLIKSTFSSIISSETARKLDYR